MASEAEREAVGQVVLTAVRQAAEHSATLRDAEIVRIGRLAALERRLFVENYCLSPDFAKQEAMGLAIIANTKRFSILVNEEDHLRIQAILPGFHLLDTWKIVKHLERSLGAYLDFAYSAPHGYLTTCPSNTGTGLRASVMMFLPGLVLLKRINPLLKQLRAIGCTVRGMYGEHSDTQGYVFQIANQMTYGTQRCYSEREILRGIEGVTHRIIEEEQHARQVLAAKHRRTLIQRITQACEQLMTTERMSLTTAIRTLSLLRLGCCLGLNVPELLGKNGQPMRQSYYLKMIDAMCIQVQPAHVLKFDLPQKPIGLVNTNYSDKKDEEETLRAQLIQQRMAEKNFRC